MILTRHRSLAAAAAPRLASRPRLSTPARPLQRPGGLRHRHREREGDQVWAAAAWQREVQPGHLLAQELHVVLHDALPRTGGRLGAGASRRSRAVSRLYLGEKAGALSEAQRLGPGMHEKASAVSTRMCPPPCISPASWLRGYCRGSVSRGSVCRGSSRAVSRLAGGWARVTQTPD